MSAELSEQEMELEELRARAISDLQSANTTEDLEEWRTRYFGREQGQLSAILRGLGKLPPEQRKAIGQAANTLKAELEKLLGGSSGEPSRAGASGGLGTRTAGRDTSRVDLYRAATSTPFQPPFVTSRGSSD